MTALAPTPTPPTAEPERWPVPVEGSCKGCGTPLEDPQRFYILVVTPSGRRELEPACGGVGGDDQLYGCVGMLCSAQELYRNRRRHASGEKA